MCDVSPTFLRLNFDKKKKKNYNYLEVVFTIVLLRFRIEKYNTRFVRRTELGEKRNEYSDCVLRIYGFSYVSNWINTCTRSYRLIRNDCSVVFCWQFRVSFRGQPSSSFDAAKWRFIEYTLWKYVHNSFYTFLIIPEDLQYVKRKIRRV